MGFLDLDLRKYTYRGNDWRKNIISIVLRKFVVGVPAITTTNKCLFKSYVLRVYEIKQRTLCSVVKDNDCIYSC